MKKIFKKNKKCRKCGKLINIRAKKCPYCGTSSFDIVLAVETLIVIIIINIVIGLFR